MQLLQNPFPLQSRHLTIGRFLEHQGRELADFPILVQKRQGSFQSTSWREFLATVHRTMGALDQFGLTQGSRVAFFCPNSAEMLAIECAVFAMGLVSVPLFSGYKERMINELLDFAQVEALVLPGQEQFELLQEHGEIRLLLHLEPLPDVPPAWAGRARHFGSWIEAQPAGSDLLEPLLARVQRDSQALLMFTSGTMSFPKGVQLTHGNILSQQEALAQIWQTRPGGCTLSYLPWHHSFGGIFEKFFCLYSGTALGLDDSRGKDMVQLRANWQALMPQYFFSVPKVFQELVTATADPLWDRAFFHGDLRFVFTAGAPLPGTISDTFRLRGVPVLEGWGLTETSPCCTLTDGSAERLPGVVGFPIPGVELAIDGEGEILVRGPNVMTGYFRNEQASAQALDAQGWFHTGDLGEITPLGLRILTRKDRIFKLANAEKVNPTAVENELLGQCPYVKQVLVFGSGLPHVCAMVFPNHERLNAPGCVPERCERPSSELDFSCCLRACIHDLNARLARHYEGIGTFIVLSQELEIEKGELTPSLKVNPQTVMKNFSAYLAPILKPGSPHPPGAIYIDVGPARRRA